MESMATFIAGCAFFLVGLKSFAANLNQITSERFRALMTKFTPNDFIAGIWGVLLSLLTAGNTMLTPCITAGFESVKAITFRKGIQIVIWSRVGSTFFIYLAGFNIKLLVLTMLGLAGISFAVNRPKKYVNLASSVFYLGLVLYGIQLIKGSTKGLIHYPWFESIVHYAHEFPIIAFVAGFLFLMAAQSLFGVLVIALSFIETGVFGIEQALLFTYGAYLGEAVLKVCYLAAFKGVFRQIISLLPAIYLVAFLVGALTYFLDSVMGIPCIHALSKALASDDKRIMANVNLFVHLVTSLILSFNVVWLERIIKKTISGEVVEEKKLRPVEIPSQILDDALTTLALINKEELRFVEYFPEFMEHVRSGELATYPLLNAELHSELKTNLETLRGIYSKLLNRSQYKKEVSSKIIQGIERHNLTMSLEENLFKFCVLIEKLRKATESDAIISEKFLNFVEAMDTKLLSLIDVLREPEEEFNVTILRKITTVRDDLMKELREAYSTSLDDESKVDLLNLFNLFESSIWLIKKIGSIVEEEVEDVQHEEEAVS